MVKNTSVRLRIVVCALVLLAAVVTAAERGGPAGTQPAQAQAGSAEAAKLLQAAINAQTIDGKLEEAIALYQRIISMYPGERAIAATALVRMAQCHEQLGRRTAQGLYERVLREYPDQQDAAAHAKARLAALVTTASPAVPGRAGGPGIRQLWPDELGVHYSDVSPDGTTLCGVDDHTGDLVVVDVATRRSTRLTNTPKEKAWEDFAESPVWSPDGRRLAYVWYAGSGSALAVSLRITDVSTSSTRSVPLPSALRLLSVFDWSPEGNAVLAAVRRPPATEQTLGWIGVAQGEFSEISSVSPSPTLSGVVSHNRGDVAYTRRDARAFEIGFVSRDGQQRGTLLTGAGDYEAIGWTPTDDGVVLMDGRFGTERLWVLRLSDGVAAGQPALLREMPGCRHIGMTAAGMLVYAVSVPGRADVFLAPYAADGPAIGPARTKINSTSDDGNVTSPAWSPDGRYVAWVTRVRARAVAAATSVPTLAIESVATGAERTIALPFQPHANGPVLGWTADGSTIFVRSGGHPQGLHAVDVASGEVSEVVPPSLTRAFEAGQDSVVVGGMSHDGRSAYTLVTTRTGKNTVIPLRTVRLIERRISDGREQVLWTNTDEVYASLPRASPDNQWIAVQLLRNRDGQTPTTLGILPAIGGSLRELFEPEDGAFTSHTWTPDSRGLLVKLTPSGGGTREVLFVPLDGAPPRPIGLSSPGLIGLAVSPDGTQLAYTEGQPGRSDGVWALDNFLPPATPAKAK